MRHTLRRVLVKLRRLRWLGRVEAIGLAYGQPIWEMAVLMIC
jgi:hypothetical protein